MTTLPDPATYINPRTGATWPTSTALWRAPDDGGYVNLTPGPGLAPGDVDAAERSLWRYAAAVRLAAPPAASLGEGWTPLIPAQWDGQPILMKAEYFMPSGSFKDRGSAVMLNYLKQAGVSEILEDSSGNAGSSVATYAAALDLSCRILLPASAPIAKRIQMAAMGADVVPVDGSRDDTARAALAEAEDTFYAGHNHQPFFLEGTKTLAFELWEQLGFRAPDCVVTPLGQGSNVMGCHIGFLELLACGAIDRMPRIYAVQAANCAPYHAAFEAGGDAPVVIEAQPTIADGIASATPVRLREVLAAVRETGGATVAVAEDEIIAALGHLARKGFFVEPTTAACGAGLTRLIADGSIKPNETAVAILTGTGLKAVEKIGAALGLD
ncbi:MAG: threonine synthase [Rhodospirillaceae bacterium]|jgi:threonine synthase|nr:threonine synthase [Rhodospirillaceae bacterium]MBT5665956.1 threonine synthase [Rhodospirillaceae bacterium]MBT5812535.1 threonine synthase [Rhodospirillaceae bacterium]